MKRDERYLPKLTKEQKEEAVRLKEEEELSYGQIAKLFNVSRQNVFYLVKNAKKI